MLKRIITNFPLEAIAWSFGLILLGGLEPSEFHVTLCPLASMGFDFCPGCGLGRSISLLLHGQLLESLRMHPLGIIAFVTLSLRVVQLTKNYLQQSWQK